LISLEIGSANGISISNLEPNLQSKLERLDFSFPDRLEARFEPKPLEAGLA
jgi:hypothetical protein